MIAPRITRHINALALACVRWPCRNSVRMSTCGLDRNVPINTAQRRRYGRHPHESEGTTTLGTVGAGARWTIEFAQGGGAVAAVLPPHQTHLATLSPTWRCRLGASAARAAHGASPSRRPAPNHPRAVPGALRRVRPDVGL